MARTVSKGMETVFQPGNAGQLAVIDSPSLTEGETCKRSPLARYKTDWRGRRRECDGRISIRNTSSRGIRCALGVAQVSESGVRSMRRPLTARPSTRTIFTPDTSSACAVVKATHSSRKLMQYRQASFMDGHPSGIEIQPRSTLEDRQVVVRHLQNKTGHRGAILVADRRISPASVGKLPP